MMRPTIEELKGAVDNMTFYLPPELFDKNAYDELLRILNAVPHDSKGRCVLPGDQVERPSGCQYVVVAIDKEWIHAKNVVDGMRNFLAPASCTLIESEDE